MKTKPLSESIFPDAMVEAMQRTIAQQSALDAIVNTNQSLAAYSASIASAMHLEREKERIRAAISPLQVSQHYLDQLSKSTMLANAIYRNEDIYWEAARRCALVETISAGVTDWLQKQELEACALRKAHEDMFRLPLAHEATRLLASYQGGAIAAFAQQQAKDALDRQSFLDAITSPWINNTEVARSVSAVLELQSMGNALRTTKGFDLGLTAALRLNLGD